MSDVHVLKTWPEFFTAVASGEKRHEIRAHDRNFNVGDRLLLREYDPNADTYTGKSLRVRVTYLTTAFLPAGMIAMSIELMDRCRRHQNTQSCTVHMVQLTQPLTECFRCPVSGQTVDQVESPYGWIVAGPQEEKPRSRCDAGADIPGGGAA